MPKRRLPIDNLELKKYLSCFKQNLKLRIFWENCKNTYAKICDFP